MTSYYDYMIGSYHSSPVQAVPDQTGAQYFVTYQGKRTPTGNRRVFYSHLFFENVQTNTEITSYNNPEGYPAMAIDPVCGKPIYTWHTNNDADTPYEVKFVSDAFLYNIAGLFNEEQVIVNNPISVTSGNTTTTNNEFIWPQMTIGPSPIAGKRRIYVMCSNATVNGSATSENPLVATADIGLEDFEMGNTITWSYRTIPELDAWNVSTGAFRRPYLTITCDNSGGLYVLGYHNAYTSSNGSMILESDMDVFKADNYGSGMWTRMTAISNKQSWNPPVSATDNTGYFEHNNIPVADNELFWRITNSNHMNAVTDGDGKIHMPGLWALTNIYGEYYPNLQFMKEMVFDTVLNQFSITDIYPRKHPDDDINSCYQPWDIEAPFGVVDEWIDSGGESVPLMGSMWNFPYWDATAHGDAMMFHYNSQKIAVNQEHDMLAVVWQNCTRAWLGPADDTNPWIHTPEIYICVSPDNGITWSEPIILNNIETPQFAGIKPMWVYPAYGLKYAGTENGQKVGKLGLMFYNDYTWGSYALSPPVHYTNDGGQVMFTELRIVFPEASPANDPFGQPVGQANMLINAEVFIDGQPASPGDKLAAFVETNGEFQLRGKATVVPTNIGNGLGCSLNLHTGVNNELIQFRIWDASTNTIINSSQTIYSIVNGVVGTWPTDLITIYNGTAQAVQNPVFQPAGGVYTSPTTVHISCSTAGAEIRYTTNGLDPTPQSTLYTGGLLIPGNTNIQIKAKAYLNGWVPSDIVSDSYTITGVLPMPMFSPAPGLYQTAQDLILSSGMENTSIFYTIDGSDPSNGSIPYTAPIHLPENTITMVKARAFKQNWVSSPIASGYFSITGTLPAPGFDPPGGSFESPVDVVLSSAIPGASIHYTLDGMEPDENSPVYQSPLHIEQSTLVRARSYKENWIYSDASEAHYSIAVAGVPEPDPVPYTGIYSCYPNPFGDRANIRLGIKGSRQAYSLDIFNIRGEKVHRITGMSNGYIDLSWDGKDSSGRRMPSGIYLLKFQCADTRQIRKIILH